MFNLYAALDVAEQQNLASQSTAGTLRLVVDTEPSTSVHRREPTTHMHWTSHA